MLARCFLFLLYIFYKVNSDKNSLKTEEYPCNNFVFVGYETSVKLDATKYQKLTDFMANSMFAKWTYVDELALLSFGKSIYKDYGAFNSKSELQAFILNDKQVESTNEMCAPFTVLRHHLMGDFYTILFVNEFDRNGIKGTSCEQDLEDLSLIDIHISFVPLSDKVNINDIKYYFSDATIIEWDIDTEDSPKDWKRMFYIAYGCEWHTTTSLPTQSPHSATPRVTKSPSDFYPCNNQILFGIEASIYLDDLVFQKQINFLTTYVFENWTHFDQLALLAYSYHLDYQHSFDSKSALTDYLRGLDNDAFSTDACGDVFYWLSLNDISNTRILLFLNKFSSSDVYDHCIVILKDVISKNNSIAFIPLSSEFDQTVLNHYFKQAKVFEWDVANNNTPTDWENKFNDFYDCKDYKATTTSHLSTTTESPINSYPPCDSTVSIAFDKSNGYTKEEYKLMQSFLVNNVFKDWTRFDRLNLFSFADHLYTTMMTLKSTAELTEFILNEKQVDNDPSICVFFDYRFSTTTDIIIFLSKLDQAEFEKTNPAREFTCQEDINHYLNSEITFVLLNDKLNTDLLREHIPQAQFIRMNLFDIPVNWDWPFLTAYGCNQDDSNDQAKYPCNSKFIFGYEVSSELNETVLDAQKYFLKEHVFNNEWNVFDNLALIAYSNETIIKDFGTLNNLSQIHDFIDSTTNQNNTSRVSLCSVLKDLTTMQLFDVNIVLFVSEFHQQIEHDECPLWIKQVRDNANFINIINLTEYVNMQYLLSHLPQATFTSWDIHQNEMPKNWSLSSFGCQDFILNKVKFYPCIADNRAIIYDKSHYLSLFAYQRLTTFLLTKVLIKQWRTILDVRIYNYPDDNHTVSPTRMKLELFVRQNLQSKKEPLVCPTLNSMKVKDLAGKFLFFVSKFDDMNFVPDKNCTDMVNNINKQEHNITFIALTPLVNKTFLLEIFPNATIMAWDIEQDEEPPEWNQMIWEAFGCSGKSPIILPGEDISTVSSTTTSLTSTIKGSTALSSTTLTSTKQPITTSLTTTTYSSSTQTTTTTQSPSNKPNIPLIVSLSVFIPLIVIILITSIVCYFLFQRRKRNEMVDIFAFNASTRNQYDAKRSEEIDLWRIDSENIEVYIDHKLGSGAFASVYLGKLYGDAGIKLVYPDILELQQFNNCEVAIKILPAYATESDKNDFKQELIFMKNLKHHKHIVCLLGYTTEKIILEYCASGDLMHFLKKKRDTFESAENESSLKLKDLISFAWQIANGMEYFSGLSLVHRDLAARNVLLTNELVCKVSDFGLARESDLQSYTSKRRMPVRWLPPEALKSSEYSTKTDVWSYGVLLYEVFSLANLPYADIENSEILHFIDSGNRLEQPEHASDEIYSIMADCWNAVPDERPNFTEICQRLIPTLETFSVHYNYVNPIEIVVEETNELSIFNDFFDDDCSVRFCK